MNRLLGNTTRRPDICFRANGRIDITSRIAKALALTPGAVIDVAEVFPGEYCLYVRHNADVCGRHEGRCYPVLRNNVKGSYRAWSKRLYNAVYGISGYRSDVLRFPCGAIIQHNETVYIPIIFKLAL